MINRKTFILTLLFLAIVFTGSYFGSKILFQFDKTKLTFSISTKESVIRINGEIIDNSVYLRPGKYIISVTKDGYFEYRKLYTLSIKDTKVEVNLISKPAQTIQNLINNSYDEVVNKYPIIGKLPYDTFLIKINYSPESTLDNFTINISAYEGYRKVAVDKRL